LPSPGQGAVTTPGRRYRREREAADPSNLLNSSLGSVDIGSDPQGFTRVQRRALDRRGLAGIGRAGERGGVAFKVEPGHWRTATCAL
jgi:hypothetical protein